eukprot:CAMPEP_0203758698 /NCGR_PEP_ID=MMETSP0098-20131031/11523_1 /ASSEMBLY_ACC=CAM_ASM_000208 /TAXON_ID=96639 /ORGANISM=" , Strain NY0313808BC1" /LENGTH=711 /DNA_ID=CAMNT_0050651241 /DNA_START=111 /DNA_END=2243 /DNA_ORIENTATION=-
MKIGKLDVIYALIVAGILATWNFGKNSEVYFELQNNLRMQVERLPVPYVLINPLGTFARSQREQKQETVTGATSEGVDENEGEDAEKIKEEDVEEENIDNEETGEEDEAMDNSSIESVEVEGTEDEAYIKAIKDAEEELRKNLLEHTILQIKVEDMRKSMETSRLTADRRFSFQLDIAPDQLTNMDSMDDEEREFAEKLKGQIAKWTSALDEIDRAASGEQPDDDTWAIQVKDQKKWESIEFNRLREAVRAVENHTLSGRVVHEPDYYEAEETQNLDAYLQEEAEAQVGSPQNYPTKPAVISPSMKEYARLVRSTEKAISFWAHTSARNVYVFGNGVYVNRDVETYSKAFTKGGFTLERRKREGALVASSIGQLDYSALICLALRNDDCFSTTGFKQIKRHQRVNRLLGLRAVLWSKDSFCKTISSGTKGIEKFTKYVFHCWIFPNDYNAAKDYAVKNPSTSFIVKPLSMGGGKGITVVDGEKGLRGVRFKTQIVQNYLTNLFLINGFKWDIRTYVLVTSTVPMRAYVFQRGLVRFASSKYDQSAKKGGKRTAYLTNTSVNKKFNKDNVTGITWSFEDLKAHFDKNVAGNAYDELMKNIQKAVSIVLLSAEQEWGRYYASKSLEACPNCFQIMGVDLIVDANMIPRVIEVNGQPSMKLSNDKKDHYSNTKLAMIQDMISMLFSENSVADQLLAALEGVDHTLLKKLKKPEW